MKKYLFIAEKPSLMRDVQNCYKKHKDEVMKAVGMIDFIPLSGHICRASDPDSYDEWNGLSWDAVDYPMIPKEWKVELIPKEKKRCDDIKNAIKNYDGMIVGTDSDVEGYGIYFLLESYLGIQNMPTLRFIEHSLTDDEILEQLLCMTDFHKDPTHIRFTQSYIIRYRTDWLYGMNITRGVSVRLGELITVGRVKGPTIKLVYDNSMAIANFKSKKYYHVEADYGDFKATLIDKDGKIMSYDDKNDIKNYPLKGVVKSVKNEQSTQHAPQLFDLTAAQGEASRKFGYNPDETLEILQSLYEKHKVISYPRTQCRFLSKSKSKEFKMMLSHMDVFDELAPYVKDITDEDIANVQNDNKVVNDAEVQKEAHDALLPTSKRPVLEEMTPNEINICSMVFKRLLAQFLPKAVDSKTEVIIEHGDGDFIAKGKSVVEQGWRKLYSESKDKTIPVLNKDDEIEAKKISPSEKNTTPPKRLTQGTLVEAMENIANLIEDSELKKSLAASKGIGTSATRSKIVKDIIQRNYIEDRKDGLYITDLGKRYIESIINLDIISPVFAAEIDTEIKQIQRGEANYEDVYEKVLDGLRNMCKQVEGIESVAKTTNDRCPICSGKIKIGRFKYECENGDFSVSKNVCGKDIDTNLLSKLIAGESSSVMTFKKKDGTKFDAKLVIKEGKLCFDTSGPEIDCKCPKCGSKLKATLYTYQCDDCDFKMQKIVCGKTIDDKLLQKLIDGETSQQFNFKKKDGSSFKARLKLVNNELSFDFSSGIQCPRCKEKEITLNKAGAFCECGLKIFKKVAGKELTDAQIKTILSKGKSEEISGFVGKSGKEFSASIGLKEDGTTEFLFSTPSNEKCPLCGNDTVKINKGGAFCDCGLKVFRNMFGHSFTDDELKKLLKKGRIDGIDDFVSKAGNQFSASVILKDGKTELEFEKK